VLLILVAAGISDYIRSVRELLEAA